MLEWNYTLRFRSPVSVFSGMAVAGLVDRMIMRTGDFLPFIPGSSVKGRWRYFAERLARSGALPSGFSLHTTGEPECKAGQEPCIVCRLFGNSSIPARIWVGQAEPAEEFKSVIQRLLKMDPNPVIHPDVELRPGIALSRVYRTARADHLFFDEALPPVPFSGKVRVEGELQPIEKTFLVASARCVDRIGARKAAGRGLLEKGIEIEGGES